MRGVIPGIGTALNTGTVLVGATIGLLVGRLLPERVLTTVMHGLGLFTLVIGISFSVGARNAVLVLVSTLVGATRGGTPPRGGPEGAWRLAGAGACSSA
jgi:uncharacterized membrane protein YqgA involved in biofilm formation